MTDPATPSRLIAVLERVSPVAVGLTALTVFAELALVLAYLGLTNAEASSIRYLLYPFVWLNLGTWAVFTADPIDASRTVRYAGGVAAVGYLLLLAYFGGLLDLAQLGHFHSHGGRTGLTLFTAQPPGWGPTIVYEHSLFTATLVPYKVVGYLALTYLVYTTLLNALTAALSGAVGFLTCVSCSWPVFASLVTGVLGGTTAATVVYSFSVDLSTAAFAGAVALLVWQPGFGESS